MTVFTIHHAKTNLSKLVAQAEAGEEIIIARGKHPAVKLVRIAGTPTDRKPGRLKGLVSLGPEAFEPMTEEELAEWE